MNLLEKFNEKKIKNSSMKSTKPHFSPGDTVSVVTKINDGASTRLHTFTGLCIAIKKRELGSTFVVRRVNLGVGVERIFPLFSPIIENITVVKYGKVRRAKLYYIRSLRGKAARIKSRTRVVADAAIGSESNSNQSAEGGA